MTWVSAEGAKLYANNDDDVVLLEVPPLTRVTALGESGTGKGRTRVEIGKGPAQRAVANRSAFEQAHNRTAGWVEPHLLREDFPAEDGFDVPDFHDLIPRLYHGSHKEAVTAIQAGRFTVSANPAVGRSLGDAVYATPYMSKAAVHAFGAAEQNGKSAFAVAFLQWEPAPAQARVLVHDRLREDRLLDVVEGANPVEKSRDLVRRMHPEAVATTAVALAGRNAVTAQEITAAARVQGYDVVLYKGHPGDNVYCLLRVSDWRVESIVLEDLVSTARVVSHGLEDLDWYHRATLLDAEQDRRNRHGRW